MTASIDQLAAAVQQLSEVQIKLVVDVQQLLAKLPESPDFSAELAQVQTSIAALQNTDAQVQAVINPPVDKTAPAPADPTNPPA